VNRYARIRVCHLVVLSPNVTRKSLTDELHASDVFVGDNNRNPRLGEHVCTADSLPFEADLV
jgi:hypothetical protein